MRFGPLQLRFPAWLLPDAVLCVGATTLTAGEPIRFSGRAGPPLAREAMAMERAPFLPAEARADRSVTRPELALDTFLLPSQAITPTTGQTRRQMEAQDRRRNWIAQSPEAIQQDANQSEEDKARDARGERSDKGERGERGERGQRDERDASKSSSMNRYLEGQEAQNDPSAKTKSPVLLRKSDRDRNATSGRPTESGDGREDSDGKGRTGWETRATGTVRSGPDGIGLFDGGPAREGSVGRTLSEARDRERQRERDASLDNFKRTFSNPWAQTAPGGASALMAPGGSATGAFSAPGGDFRRPSSSGGLGMSARTPVDLGPRGGGGFDPQNPLNYGAPSTVLRQPDPPRAVSKPVVLEIPKRKF